MSFTARKGEMMAIYGVTTREALDPRFKVLGKLRKGGPKRNGQFGKDLDWFRFTSDNDAVVKAFRQAYGDQPDTLAVFFPFATLEANFPTYRETYGQNELLKEQCDGMNILQWQDGARMVRGPRLCEKKCKNVESLPPCPDCPLKPIGRLSVILIPLLQAGFVGTVTVETHGWHDIREIASQLAMYEPLTGREFRVYRQKQTIGAPNPKTGKRMAVDKSLVKIEPTQETYLMLIEDAQRRAKQELGAGSTTNTPQLAAGQPLTPDLVVDFDGDGGDDYDEVLDEDFEDDEAPTQREPKAEPHWIESDVVRKRFWAYVGSLTLSEADVHEALSVEHIKEYAGTMAEAKAALDKYVSDRIAETDEAEATVMPDVESEFWDQPEPNE